MTFQILSPLHRATRQITLTLEQCVADLGLAMRADEAHALSYIAAYGPCPTGNIQRVLGSSRSTITSLLDRLVKRGYIVRHPDSSDARVVLLTITEAGQAVASQVEVSGHQLEARIMQQLSDKDLAALQRICAAIDQATNVTVVHHHSQEQ